METIITVFIFALIVVVIAVIAVGSSIDNSIIKQQNKVDGLYNTYKQQKRYRLPSKAARIKWQKEERILRKLQNH